jgi:hypothetical protein
MEEISAPLPPPRKYRLSGKFGPYPLVLFAACVFAGALFGPVLWAVGGAGDQLKILAAGCCLAGAALGIPVAWLGHWLKCRNYPFLIFTMLATLVAAVYGGTAITAMMNVVDNKKLSPPITSGDLVLNPDAVWQSFLYMTRLPFAPDTEMRERMFATFIGVPGIAIIAFVYWFNRKIFCEGCGGWLDIQKTARFAVPDDPLEMENLKAGNLDYALQQRKAAGTTYISEPPFVRLDFALCPHCGNTGVYRLVLVSSIATKDTSSDESNISPLMMLTPERAPMVAPFVAAPRSTTRGVRKRR